jgi:hypothetical protein
MKRLYLILLLFPCLLQAQTAQELSAVLSASSQDYFVTGQGSQLTAGNNITLPTAGTAAQDAVAGGTISYRSVHIQIIPASGTVSAGVISFEGSNDNFVSTALPVFLYDLSSITAAPVSSYTVVAATPRYFGGNVYFKYFRARISTGITGTTTGVQAFTVYKATPFMPTVQILVQPTGANANVTATISGTPSVNATPVTYATNGTTTSTLNSAATTNATSLKATAGILYAVTAMNTSAAIKYIRIYNKASAPTVGTDIPIMVIAVPATASKEVWFPVGIKFSTGIAYAITNAASATDATAVAAGDVQLLVNWQ